VGKNDSLKYYKLAIIKLSALCFTYSAMLVITFYARRSGGINNRNRFPGGLYRPWACQHSPSKTFQLLIYFAHNVQRVCNERVQHVISRIMTLLCTQTRVTTPGTTLSGTPPLPKAIRVKGGFALLRSRLRDRIRRRKEKKRKKKNCLFFLAKPQRVR